MTRQPDQATRDEWQTQLYEAAHRFSASLRELNDKNPWPEGPALGQALNTLATELWDQRFGATEIITAFAEAAADLPRYTAGDEYRP